MGRATIFLIIFAVISLVALFSLPGKGAEAIPQAEDLKSDGLVEVQYSADALAPYKVRRSNWGTLFSLSYEQMLPTNYVPADSKNAAGLDAAGNPRTLKYQDLYGNSPIKMIQLAIGPKLNFALGSVSAEILFGSGQVADARENNLTGNAGGAVRSLNILKKGAQFSYILDNFFKEPYVAPYVSAQFFSLTVSESNTYNGTMNSTTALTTAFQGGLLFQLNALDETSALRATNSMGLNNTYLDIYVSKYNTSTNSSDVDLETGANLGVGIKLEY